MTTETEEQRQTREHEVNTLLVAKALEETAARLYRNPHFRGTPAYYKWQRDQISMQELLLPICVNIVETHRRQNV